MFEGDRYTVKQKVRIGDKYNVYEGDELILQSAQKKLRLKEDVRFSDPDGNPVLRVRAGQILDVAATYEVVDERTDEQVGAIERDWTSFLRHHWVLAGPDGETVGRVTEDNLPLALARRYVTTLIPFHYDVVGPDGEHLGDIDEKLRLRDVYTIDLSADAEDRLDPRLVVAAGVVIDAIEEN